MAKVIHRSIRHIERQIKIVKRTRNILPLPVREEAIVLVTNAVAGRRKHL